MYVSNVIASYTHFLEFKTHRTHHIAKLIIAIKPLAHATKATSIKLTQMLVK